jgi:hypothetical protein
LAALWGAFFLLLSPASVRAEGRPVVQVVLSPELRATQGFEDALTAQLADLEADVRLEAREGAAPSAALALARATHAQGVVWISHLAPDLFVFVIDAAAEAALVRTIPAAEPSEFASQEATAVIVRGSVEGLIAGQRVGLSSPAPIATAPAPVQAQPIEPEPALRALPELSVGYLGTSLSAALPFQHGLRLGALISDVGLRGLYIHTALSLLRGQRATDARASLLLTRTPLELGAGYRFMPRGFGLAFDAGGALEITRREARAETAGVIASDDRTRVSALAVSHLWLLARLGGTRGRTLIALGGGAEIPLHNVDYQVQIVRAGSAEPESANLLSPRAVRGLLLAQVVVRL